VVAVVGAVIFVINWWWPKASIITGKLSNSSVFFLIDIDKSSV